MVSTLTLVGLSADAGNSASAQALAAQLSDHPENIKLREKVGEAYIANKNYEKAIEILAPYSNEISNGGLELLALAYGQTKDSLNQIRTLTELTEKDSNHFRPHYFLGLAYKLDGKKNEAAKELRRSIDLAPSHRPSYDALLEIFLANKQNYEARL